MVEISINQCNFLRNRYLSFDCFYLNIFCSHWRRLRVVQAILRIGKMFNECVVVYLRVCLPTRFIFRRVIVLPHARETLFRVSALNTFFLDVIFNSIVYDNNNNCGKLLSKKNRSKKFRKFVLVGLNQKHCFRIVDTPKLSYHSWYVFTIDQFCVYDFEHTVSVAHNNVKVAVETISFKCFYRIRSNVLSFECWHIKSFI